MINALLTLHDRLCELAAAPHQWRYDIPALWLAPEEADSGRVVAVDPAVHYRDCVAAVLAGPDETPVMGASSGEWTAEAVTYNMFTRLTAAWDHDGDGRVELDDLPGGWRETGTFLKSVALLPYLKSLGVNTIHLLPVTSIGKDGNKGSLGSPYAIRNPFKLDERLAEPALGLGPDAEFGAFVEAAHRLGMRVVMEFVFRTAAKDSEWIPEHPNWFYWIGEDIPDREASAGTEHGYGNPRFSQDELRVIQQRVKRNDTSSLPPPSMFYRQMFRDTPTDVVQEGERWIGKCRDGSRARIPGAFADWPPDDVQPPWGDVTYLKLYDHHSFNYIAYNTIRMYDARLAAVDHENRGLWNTIINIIPHYQKHFSIDGVMIDMGHALPRRLKQSMVDRARKVNPDFAFWEENFAISARSRQEGYNASVGYLWCDEHLPEKLRAFCEGLAQRDVPVPFFATPESHNTPRAAARQGGIAFSRLALALNAFLPGMYYLHQGVELGESFPVNTGLGFTAKELDALPSHNLPLFSASALCWTNPNHAVTLVRRVLALRERYADIITHPSASTVRILESSVPSLLAIARLSPDGDRGVVVIANLDPTRPVEGAVLLVGEDGEGQDLLSERIFPITSGRLPLWLEPGEVLIFDLNGPAD
jgi:starch synthase (maltosyl-transferring)